MSNCGELLVENEYTTKQVTKILINFWQVWAMFEPKATATDSGTHFESNYSSRSPRDGKRSSRRKEELLCALLDIEEALPLMPEGMKDKLMQHYILDTKDVESEVERVTLYRCVQRLTRIMNDKKRNRNGQANTRYGGSALSSKVPTGEPR